MAKRDGGVQRAPRSHQQSFRSTLPEFVVTHFTVKSTNVRPFETDVEMVGYVCQRPGCGKGFGVTKRDALRGTAPCPHCFKVSRVPG
jgi:hypothetical protein